MPTQKSTVAVMAPASNDACGVFNNYTVCFGGRRVFDNEPWLTAPITGGLERVLNLNGTWEEVLRFSVRRGWVSFWGGGMETFVTGFEGDIPFDSSSVANMIRGNATVVTPPTNSQTSDFNSYQVRFVGPQQMFSGELWTTTLINGSVQRACNVGGGWNEMVNLTTRPTRPVQWVGVGCPPTNWGCWPFNSCGCSPIGWNPLSGCW